MTANMYMKMIRRRFLFVVGLLIIVCVVVTYIPVHTRVLPGYETLQQTDQALTAADVAYSIEERLGNKTAVDDYGFPTTGDFCGDKEQWKEYVHFHRSVVTGKQNGRFLKYTCSKLRCGGFGNRIEGITMGLVMSMLTNRVFLLEFYHPFDFSKYLLPNLIDWKFQIPKSLDRNVKSFDLMNKERIKKQWNVLETLLLNPAAEDTIELTTNMGVDMFIADFGDTILKRFLNMKINTFHNYTALYGCVMRYLFKQSPVITDSILREQKSLDLSTDHYVAVHIRTGRGENSPDLNLPSSEYWKPYFECAVSIAKVFADQYCFRKTCPVYVLTDIEEVKEYGILHYGDYIKTSTVYMQHIDNIKINIPQLVEDTFVGLITDIEVAARAAIFIGTEHSTFSDLIEGIGFHTSRTTFDVKHCSKHHSNR